uniref:Translation initiation factor IF-3 n=1 Tax=Apophlaea sinclairii TaxID=212746 RepID=A0A1C9CBL1_9FLOR|nr:translation initiation factor 3 [Apophlaea sinclairii]AOM65780.1 translation initiation factor 3 [Apophlaea sinclairii]
MAEKNKVNNHNNSNLLMINEQINYPSIRVINHIGQQLGIFNSHEAVKLAKNENMDLVLVNNKCTPPVCKILNYGKYKFAQEKRARKAKRKQQSSSLKEVKMRYKIETHDYKVKLNQTFRFLEARNKVKVTITFKGREIQHLDLAILLLNRMAKDLHKTAEIQQKPYREGKNLIMLLSAKKSLI